MTAKANRLYALFATHALGAAALGATAGWLIGLTGDSSQVPAAVVAGLLAALLGWLFLASRKEDVCISVLASFVVIVFCGTLFLAERETSRAVESDDRFSLLDRKILLEWCSQIEFEINRERKMGGLPPLSSEFFCGVP